MTKTVITKEAIAKLESEFDELFSRFRPEIGNVDDINILKAMTKARAYQRLRKRHVGNKKEGHYRNRMYNELVRLVPAFRYYYKIKQKNQ